MKLSYGHNAYIRRVLYKSRSLRKAMPSHATSYKQSLCKPLQCTQLPEPQSLIQSISHELPFKLR